MLDIARHVLRRPERKGLPLDDFERRVLRTCQPFTMTSPERLLAVIDAVTYLGSRHLPGAFVECGVWRGGSIMAMLLTLLKLGERDRDVYLFDTFEGMTEPGERDVSDYEPPARVTWDQAKQAGRVAWASFFNRKRFSEAQVRGFLATSGYPAERIHFVKGKVEDTVPAQAPGSISLLRLDTDWYASTRHELQHLYPRLAAGGVLIVDDYGHWKGCRQAVDEYFDGDAPRPLLTRIDYTGRLAVKP